VFPDEFQLTVANLSRGLALVSVSGELDLHTTPELQDGIDKAGATGADTVVIDLSMISFIDSSALGVLVQETRRLEGRGDRLALVTNDPRTLRLFEVSGLNRVLRTYATLQDALADLQDGSAQALAVG
jgi:anti-sigma B factor antagonist